MQRKDLFVVELEKGVWLKCSEQNKDTLVFADAERFLKFKDAKVGLDSARRHYKYFNAKIRRVE